LEKDWLRFTGGINPSKIRFSMSRVAVSWGRVFGIGARASDKDPAQSLPSRGGKAPLPEFAEHRIGNLLSGAHCDPKDVEPLRVTFTRSVPLRFDGTCVFCLRGLPASAADLPREARTD
jgi:hypothetical protein